MPRLRASLPVPKVDVDHSISRMVTVWIISKSYIHREEFLMELFKVGDKLMTSRVVRLPAPLFLSVLPLEGQALFGGRARPTLLYAVHEDFESITKMPLDR